MRETAIQIDSDGVVEPRMKKHPAASDLAPPGVRVDELLVRCAELLNAFAYSVFGGLARGHDGACAKLSDRPREPRELGARDLDRTPPPPAGTHRLH